MLYSEIKRSVLSLINQYSIAGETIPSSYNNQADYLSRIPANINMGLVNIRTGVKRDNVVYELDYPEMYGGMRKYKLPSDFYAMKTGGVCRLNPHLDHDHLETTNKYKLQGKNYILVPDDGAQYVIEYYRYPDLLPLDPPDNYDVDEDSEVLFAAIFYAAANIVMYNDRYQYASLYNDYESRLDRMRVVQEAEVHPVEDAYRFGGAWDV